MSTANAVSTRAAAGDGRTAFYKRVTGAALVLIALGCTVGVVVPAGLGWDFANFYDAGHRVVARQTVDLYHQERPVAGGPTQGNMRFWGAPLSAALYAPLAFLRPELALIVFKLQNIMALAVALALLYRHCHRFLASDPARSAAFSAMFAGLCLIYQPFWTTFRVGGQSTATVMLLLVAALHCYTAGRLRVTALLLVGAVMIKPTLVTLLVFLACVSGWPFVLALAIGTAFLALLSVAVMGWPIHVEFLRVLVEGSQLSRPWHFNSSLYVPLENLRLLRFTPAAAPGAAAALLTLMWCVKCAVVAMFATIVRSSRRRDWPGPARRHFEFLMSVSFWLLISQTLWEHYLAMLFIPLIYIVAVRRWFPPTAHYLVGAICALCLGQNLILMELLWTRIDIQSAAGLIAIGLFKAGPLLFTLLLLWRYQASLFASYTAPAWTSPST